MIFYFLLLLCRIYIFIEAGKDILRNDSNPNKIIASVIFLNSEDYEYTILLDVKWRHTLGTSSSDYLRNRSLLGISENYLLIYDDTFQENILITNQVGVGIYTHLLDFLYFYWINFIFPVFERLINVIPFKVNK